MRKFKLFKLFKKKVTEERFVMMSANLLGRIEKLEDTVFALKKDVKQEKKNEDMARKKKWLTGYPDETNKDQV